MNLYNSKRLVYLVKTPQKTVKFNNYLEAINLYDKLQNLNINVQLDVQYETALNVSGGRGG